MQTKIGIYIFAIAAAKQTSTEAALKRKQQLTPPSTQTAFVFPFAMSLRVSIRHHFELPLLCIGRSQFVRRSWAVTPGARNSKSQSLSSFASSTASYT